MSIKYIMTVGLHNYEASHNRDGLGELNADACIKEYVRKLSLICGGCTLTHGVGGYVRESGTLVTERVAILSTIDAVDSHGTQLRAIARELCHEFREECVLLESFEVRMQYVRS